MRLLSAHEIVRGLERQGMSFRSFSETHVGRYEPSDADWNYKDVPHLHEVHELVRAVIARMDDDHVASINLQKTMGLRLPMPVFNYATGPDSQTYYTAWLFFVLVVETTYASIEPGVTRVVTTYHVGASRPLIRLLFPVVRAALRKNYRALMEGDIPMRERRGWLRRRGFRFVDDPGPHSFEASVDTSGNKLVVPPPNGARTIEVDLSSVDADGGVVLVGEPDQLGVRVVRDGERVRCFPRLCLHEGACLDDGRLVAERVRCPWHGRTWPALATFDLGATETQSAESEHIALSCEGTTLRVQPRTGRGGSGRADSGGSALGPGTG